MHPIRGGVRVVEQVRLQAQAAKVNSSEIRFYLPLLGRKFVSSGAYLLHLLYQIVDTEDTIDTVFPVLHLSEDTQFPVLHLLEDTQFFSTILDI